MGCRGIEIWVAEATEHTKGGVVRELLMKELVGDDMLYRSRWAPVEQICGSGQGFSPVWWWHGGVEQQSADGVVDGAKYAFGFAFLLRGVGAGEAQADAVAGEEVSSGPVEELGTIISLKCFGDDAKLRTSESDELNKMAMNLRFVA